MQCVQHQITIYPPVYSHKLGGVVLWFWNDDLCRRQTFADLDMDGSGHLTQEEFALNVRSYLAFKRKKLYDQVWLCGGVPSIIGVWKKEQGLVKRSKAPSILSLLLRICFFILSLSFSLPCFDASPFNFCSPKWCLAAQDRVVFHRRTYVEAVMRFVLSTILLPPPPPFPRAGCPIFSLPASVFGGQMFSTANTDGPKVCDRNK